MLFLLICVDVTRVFYFVHACCFVITLSVPASCFTGACSEQESGTGVLTQYLAAVFLTRVSIFLCLHNTVKLRATNSHSENVMLPTLT